MLRQEEWDHAKRILEAALDLDEAAREPYILQATAGSSELLDEVQSLLAWHEDAGDFLEAPAARVANLTSRTGDSLIGRALGVWRITDVVGRGGMGIVYRAERADDTFSRHAAIKVMSAGAVSPEMVERFRRERETLASLDHPTVARVLDGGSTPDGEPYLVMEFVEGLPLDEYCDTRRLSIEDRLRLFRAVCRGVQYAHQNLVVHRDLKPDNILVTEDGTPKLLDFGIARLLSESSDDGDAGGSATWLMTPDFASPEQIAGRAAGTSADVYSLGVLLHVLLTGERPFTLKARTIEGLRSELAVSTLIPPSDRVNADTPEGERRAQARGCRPGTLARRLRGDLDAIVARALRRMPEDRYTSVDALVEDLERHRTHHPVTARPRELRYLGATFIRRNAAAITIAAAVLGLAAIGVAAVLWQASLAADARRRAEHRFADVRRLAQVFMFDVHDQIAHLEGGTAARELLVRTGSEYLQSLAQEASGDIGLQRELAAGFVKLGDAQGHPNAPTIGDTSAARASYDQAIALAGAVLAADPGDLEASRTLAMAHRKQGDVLAWTGRMPLALEHSEKSRLMFAAVAGRPGATIQDRLQAAIAEIKRGDLLGNPNFPNAGREREAMSHYGAALASLRLEDGETRGDPALRRYLGLTLERLGTMHEQAQRLVEAGAAYGESYAIRLALAADAPLHADVQRDLAIALEKLGNVRQFSGDLAGSLDSHRQALAQFERLAAADPANATAERSVAISRENVAGALMRLERNAEARAEVAAALQVHTLLSSRDPANTQARCDVARVQEMAGDLENGAGACRSWAASLRTRRALAGAAASCAAAAHLDRLTARLLQCR